MPDTPILVTQPSLPDLEEFTQLLKDIWERKWLTNNGTYHRQFEAALAAYLGVEHVSLFCNGTIALQVGLQALGITGQVITTPYSFPATTHAIHWNHCTPVFCDVSPASCNLDPSRLETLITPRTTCILPVHVYGTPCDVRSIQEIAERHGLRVLYDAAHAFGVKLDGESVLNFGDISMLSFHATKVFNTIEGGALITSDPTLKERIDLLKNFGFANETTVLAPGTNGKMNEIQAAYGLLLLKNVGTAIAERRRLADIYRRELSEIPGIRVLDELPGVAHNGSYFPVFVDEGQYGRSRDGLYSALKDRGIHGRRYFYPLISSFPMYQNLASAAADNLPVAARLSEQVICLPLFSELGETEVRRIAGTIRGMCAPAPSRASS